MAIEQINPGSAPILWSTIDEAFKIVNNNFTELALSVGGGSLVDLTALASTVGPVDDNTYDLGKADNRWRDLYLNQYAYIGQARIGSEGPVINLPAGSTIGDSGQLLDESYFKTIAVSGQNNVIADQGTDTLNLSTGTGIAITTNAATDTITFTNSGVTSLSTGSGISVSSATGDVVVTNTGVTSLSGTVGEIGVDSNTGSVTLTNLGVIELTTDPGSGIGLSATKGSINISNLSPNIAQNVFRFISVPGQGIIEADSIADTLTIAPGYGVAITTTPLNDTVTIRFDQNVDIIGSVFAENSSIMVDAIDQKIYAAGGFFGALTGNADSSTVASTVSLTATNSTAATHYITFVDSATGNETIRTDTDLKYNPSTDTLTAGTFSGNFSGTLTGNIFTNLIDSADSSAIFVTPITRFQSDVIVENDLIVTQRLTLRGSRVLNLTDLKAVVASSTSFADFQARIAALV